MSKNIATLFFAAALAALPVSAFAGEHSCDGKCKGTKECHCKECKCENGKECPCDHACKSAACGEHHKK